MSEPGETFEQTALRELREETGIDARVDQLTGLYYKHENDSHHLVFRCSVEGSSQPTPSSSEISECGCFAVDELPRPISDFTIRRIRDALEASSPRSIVAVEALAWLD
jgi:8-oxo-dGTP pyrophosphatase MutT (NUDIX family)